MMGWVLVVLFAAAVVVGVVGVSGVPMVAAAFLLGAAAGRVVVGRGSR